MLGIADGAFAMAQTYDPRYLTMHNVTKSVVLDVAFHGAGNDPFSGKGILVGFDAKGMVKRVERRIRGLSQSGDVYVYFKHEDDPQGALNAAALLESFK